MSKLIRVELPERSGVDEETVAGLARRMMSDNGLDEYSITVAAVDDGAMADLNQRFRGILGPTDVLSFTVENDPLEGEIYLSLEQAADAAKVDGTSVAEEVYKLIIHGILHLIGCHHDEPDSAKLNRELIQRYMSTGVASKNSNQVN